MPKALDLTGQKFGKLTAISKLPSKNRKTYWLCKCDCGNETEVQTSHLRNGNTQSCGKCNRSKYNTKSDKVTEHRKRLKIALVEANNHKCAYCGLEDHYQIYDFHHVNPETKLFQISGCTKGKDKIVEEAKKCVMLCANCHRKVENKLIPNEFEIIFDEEKFYQTLSDLIE